MFLMFMFIMFTMNIMNTCSVYYWICESSLIWCTFLACQSCQSYYIRDDIGLLYKFYQSLPMVINMASGYNMKPLSVCKYYLRLTFSARGPSYYPNIAEIAN